MDESESPAAARADAFAIMANASPVMIWVTDKTGRLLFVNQACQEFFQLTETDLRDRRWAQLLHPDDADAYIGQFDLALRQRTHFRSRGRFLRHDGVWRWVDSTAAPYWSRDNIFLGMVGSSPDITELVEHEQALEASEDRFRHMADNSPVLIWVTEPDGSCSFLSKSWYDCTGQTPEAGLGFGWINALHPEDQGYARETFLEANAKRSRFRLEYRLRRKDGSYLWVIDTAAPRFDANGRFLGYVGSVIDITERKTAEDILKQTDRRKNEFLATLAHELRNPLAPLRTGLEIMRLSSGDPGTMARTRDLMERQVEQLVRLIDDLMDVARITTGKLHLSMSRVDVSHLIDLALETTNPIILDRAHTVTVTKTPSPIWIEADSVRITQVFANILTNAAKYTPRSGKITVELRKDAGDAVIRVTDSGIGVPIEYQPQVFDLFSQNIGQQDRLADETSGLGIGLHLVKRLVELHGGQVRLTSAGPGTGTTVEVRLPAVRDSTTDGLAYPSDTTCVDKRKILVVDDNVDAAQSLALLLRLQGHDVETAFGGEAGLAAAEKFRPDMMLLDLRMPRVHGYQVARELRATEWGKKIVLIALSGYGQEDDFAASKTAGFDYHLVKPVDPKQLQAFFRPNRRQADLT